MREALRRLSPEIHDPNDEDSEPLTFARGRDADGILERSKHKGFEVSRLEYTKQTSGVHEPMP